MRKIGALIMAGLSVFLMSAGERTDFEKAKAEAKANNKLVLLTFSGSDWCLPCIKMEKQVFEQESFKSFAGEKLEVVNADFPRLKKNQPSADVKKQNEMLAEQYDKDGHFPYTVLLDADGKVLKTWDGYKGEKPDDFIKDIKTYAGS